MANRDRLTGLDAAFLHLETGRRAHARRLGSSSSRARRPPTTSSSRRSRRACTSCRATARSSPSCRSARAGRCGSTTRTSTPRYHVRHTRAARARRPTSSCATSPGALFAQPLDRTKPLWEIWLVEGLEGDRFALISQDPPRARRRRLAASTSPRSSSTPRPTPRPSRAPRPRLGARARADAAPSCSPRRCSSAPRCPAEVARGAARAARARRAQVARAGWRRGSSASARWPGPGSARRRRRPFNVPIGPHRRYTWVDADLARFKAIKNALGGTRQRRRAHGGRRSRSGASCAAAAIDTDGLVLKAMVPVSVRADDAARRARQPRRGDVGAAARRRRPIPRRCFDEVARGDGRAQGVRPGRRRRGADRSSPTSRRRRSCRQAARLQARQRFFNLVVTNVPGPAVPALPARPPAARASTPSSRSRQHQALGHRDHELRRAPRLRPARRLRRAARPRGARRRPARGDRRARRAAGLPASAPRPRERHRLAGRRRTPARAELAAGDARRGPDADSVRCRADAHRARPDQRHRRRHRRQRGARSREQLRARARGRRAARALPRAGAHRLPARGPAAQGALPRRRARGARADRRRRATASSRSSASPSAPTTSTTPRPCSPTARSRPSTARSTCPTTASSTSCATSSAAPGGAIDRGRRRQGRPDRSARTSGCPAPPATDEALAGARLIVNISASPYHARQGRASASG